MKPKVLLLTSEASPYRLPLFEKLSEKVELEVVFCILKSKKRFWEVKLDSYSFKYKVLKSINVGPLIINYLLPFEISLAPYQVIIIDDEPRLTFSKLTVFLMAKYRHLLRAIRKPIVIWAESIELGYYNKINDFVNRYLFWPIRHLIYHYADAFLAYGPKTRDFLIKNGIVKEKIYISINAVPETEIKGFMHMIDKEELKEQLGFSHKKVVLFVGYFTKRKGVVELINAFKQLNRNDTILIMVGAGPEEKRLKVLAEGYSNIYFPGYLEKEEKAKYYAIADIFVLPTFVDPWPLVINEAMMFGLPIITTTGCGASELIKGNGIVIKPGDIDALRESMKYLIENDEVRTKMGAKSKEIIKEYTIDKAVERIVEVVHAVLNKGVKR